MKKKKYTLKKINATDEDVRNKIRNLESVLNDKVDFSISSRKGKIEKIKYHFSSNNPEIKIENKKVSLKVEFSSNQQDNDRLLHFLFDKTRK